MRPAKEAVRERLENFQRHSQAILQRLQRTERIYERQQTD